MSETPSKKYRPDAAYARSADTRDRIIQAATALFGERGFQAASTRDIARRAEVNSPLLNYYFSNKEGLYRACAASIATSFMQYFRPVQDSVNATLAGDASAEALQAQLEKLLSHSLEFILSNQKTPHQRLFLAQDYSGNGPEGLPDEVLQQVREEHVRTLFKLVARLTGADDNDQLAFIRTATLQGQIAIFYSSLRPILKMLGWERVDEEKLALIRQVVIEQSRTLIQSWRNANT